MIEEIKKKMYFVAAPVTIKGRKVDRDTPPEVYVSTKYSVLTFNKKTLETLNLNDKFVRFYTQKPNIIAWKVHSKLTQADLQSKAYRFVKIYPKISSSKLSITSILSQLDVKKDFEYVSEVKKYIEKDPMEKGEVYYFIELKNEKTKGRRCGKKSINTTSGQTGIKNEVSNDSTDVGCRNSFVEGEFHQLTNSSDLHQASDVVESSI